MRYLFLALAGLSSLITLSQTDSRYSQLRIKYDSKYAYYSIEVAKEITPSLKKDIEENFSNKRGIYSVSIPNTKTFVLTINKSIKTDDIISLLGGCNILINEKKIEYQAIETHLK